MIPNVDPGDLVTYASHWYGMPGNDMFRGAIFKYNGMITAGNGGTYADLVYIGGTDKLHYKEGQILLHVPNAFCLYQKAPPPIRDDNRFDIELL